MNKVVKKAARKSGRSASARPAARPTKPAPARATTAGATGSASAARLSLPEVMRLLERAGSEATRKTYQRHGVRGPMFGVKFGDLFTLMKRIDVDHALARELWAMGNVDARNLAMKIADPLEITAAELDRWVVENEMSICNLYLATLAAESPHGRARLREWLRASDERLQAAGWTLLGRLSDLDESLQEDELLRHLAALERSIHAAPGAVRSDMHRALITLGGRSPTLRKAVLAAARRIGPVSIDRGGTASEAADVGAAVEKAWARSQARFPSPAAHERSMKSMRRRC